MVPGWGWSAICLWRIVCGLWEGLYGYRMGKLSEDAAGIWTRYANGKVGNKVLEGTYLYDIIVEIHKFQHHDARLKLVGLYTYRSGLSVANLIDDHAARRWQTDS